MPRRWCVSTASVPGASSSRILPRATDAALEYTGSCHGHQKERRQEQEEQEAHRGGHGRARGHRAARGESEAKGGAAPAAVSASPPSGKRGLRPLAPSVRVRRSSSLPSMCAIRTAIPLSSTATDPLLPCERCASPSDI